MVLQTAHRSILLMPPADGELYVAAFDLGYPAWGRGPGPSTLWRRSLRTTWRPGQAPLDGGDAMWPPPGPLGVLRTLSHAHSYAGSALCGHLTQFMPVEITRLPSR